MDIHLTGDAMNSNNVLQRLKEAEAEKQAKCKKNNKELLDPASDASDDNDDINHCISCGKEWIDGQEKLWVVCDEYYRWYHYK